MKCISCIIGTVYKPPTQSNQMFVEKLLNFITSLGSDNEHLILTGDTNICSLKSEFNCLENVCTNLGLCQVITEPTHRNRRIDHIFVSTSLTVISSGVDPPVENFHSQTWVKVLMEYKPTQEDAKKVKWKFKQADWSNLNVYLMKSKLLCVVQEAKSVHLAASILQAQIQEGMSLFIPNGTSKKNRQVSGCFSNETLQLFYTKRKTYRKWRKSQSTQSLALYKKIEKSVRKRVYVEKRENFHKAFQRCQDASEFWKTLNHFTGCSRTSDIPLLLTPTGVEVTESRSKADVLCQQFAFVFNEGGVMKMYRTSINDIFPEASVKDFLKVINKLSNKKAMGIDNIPAVVLKKCVLVIAPCLAFIADRCIREGDFPNIWKKAIVTPVPKVKGSNKHGDYRPVSLLPLMSKLVEIHLNKILRLHIDHHLSNNQYGFRQGRFTVDAILTLQHYVLKGFEACEKAKRPTSVVVVFFDPEKAFDSVPHKHLLEDLETKYGFPESLLCTISSYLSEREMKAKVGEESSDSASMTSGVPQGSVVGPTLFIAYIDAVTKLNLHSDSKLILYADDLALVHPVCHDSSLQNLQLNINDISDCVRKNGLKLNIQKYHFLVISLSNSHRIHAQLFLLNKPLEQVTSYKYLGVEVDENFTFGKHTSKAVLKAKKCIGTLNRMLRKWASTKILSQAISTIALPAMFYAIEAWYPPHKKHQQQI
jgi:hypothetical protein